MFYCLLLYFNIQGPEEEHWKQAVEAIPLDALVFKERVVLRACEETIVDIFVCTVIQRKRVLGSMATATSSISTPLTHLAAESLWCMRRWLTSSSKLH